MEYHYYVSSVIARGELYLELERVRRLLVLAEERPSLRRQDQIEHVKNLSGMFRALLAAKDMRVSTLKSAQEIH